MKRPTVLVLTGATVLGLAIAGVPRQAGFAQGDPFLGTWQLNLAKSKYSPGPPPRGQSLNIQADGQNHKITITGIDPAGNSITRVLIRGYDGMPHPVSGTPRYDAQPAARVDASTIIVSFTKAGKLVETGTMIVSSDGKTRTYSETGTDTSGRPFNNIEVYDKQ
jgi:hypothetical protein